MSDSAVAMSAEVLRRAENKLVDLIVRRDAGALGREHLLGALSSYGDALLIHHKCVEKKQQELVASLRG